VEAPSVLIAGRYRLVRRVGSGGMGVVWEAWDERLHRTVAVKQLHAQLGLSDAETHLANERAMREARITARLDHPNAVPVFDVVEHAGQPCLIMQYLPSEPLSAVLKEKKVLPFDEVARIGAQVGSALAAAHRLGIIHRDVKPGNVLLAANGTARISDFGISHALGDVTLTSTGMVHGTPAYLAPEVARGSDSTFSSDVFGLGATLYAAVEGAPPFGTNQNSIALIYKVASGEFDPPNPEGPLSPLLLRMLAADPAERPAMGDVVQALDAATGRGATAVDIGGSTKVMPAAQLPSPTTLPPEAPPPAGATRPPVAASAAAAGSAEHDQQTARTVPAQAPSTPDRASAGAGGHQGPPSDDAHPWSTSPEPSDPAGSRPGRTLGRVALALALVAGLAVLLVNVLPGLRSGSGDPGEGAVPAPSTSVSAQPSSSSTDQQPTPSATPAPSTPATSPSRAPTTPSAAPTTPSPTPKPTESASDDSDDSATAAQLGQAITGYYGLVPGNTDGGWSRLTSSYQSRSAGSRSSYERFWGRIDRVTVSDVEGDPPDEVEATVTYYFKDGRVSRERTEYELRNDDGVLKINSSRVRSASTIRN